MGDSWGGSWGTSWGTSWGAGVVAATTNSGVQRLRAFHESRDRQDHYRDVARKQALQVQQIRLSELQQQQREIEAKRLFDEALRKAAIDQKPRERKAAPDVDSALDDRISALVRELADVNGALAQTRAEIVRLDAIEAQEAREARELAMRLDDEAIIILAASI